MKNKHILLFGGIFILFLTGLFFPGHVAWAANLTDSFDTYPAGDNLASAPGTLWTVNGSLGDWLVTNSGCLSGNCVSGTYDTSGYAPDDYIEATSSATSGNVDFWVKISESYQADYNSSFNLDNIGTSSITYLDGIGLFSPDGANTVLTGFGTLTPGVWYELTFYWVTDPVAGSVFSLSLNGSLPVNVATSTNTLPVNGFEMINFGHGATTYVDQLDSQFLNLAAINVEDYNAISTSTCEITNISGCFQNALVWAFNPPSGAFNNILGIWGQVDTKPPFGYFTVAQGEINGLGTSTSPYTLASVAGITEYIFTPLDEALAAIWWAIFGIWFFFNRVRHIEI